MKPLLPLAVLLAYPAAAQSSAILSTAKLKESDLCTSVYDNIIRIYDTEKGSDTADELISKSVRANVSTGMMKNGIYGFKATSDEYCDTKVVLLAAIQLIASDKIRYSTMAYNPATNDFYYYRVREYYFSSPKQIITAVQNESKIFTKDFSAKWRKEHKK